MLLNVKSIALYTAVICFFVVAIIGWTSKLTSFTCCKRSLIAAAAVYVVTACAAKSINVILTNALINSRAKQQQKEIQDNREN